MYKSLFGAKGLFCYALRELTIPAGATIRPNITLGNDSDFVLRKIMNYGVVHGDPDAVISFGDVHVQFSFDSGELWSNIALDASFFLPGENKLRFLKENFRIETNSQINISITNNTAADVTYEVQLWGFKIQPGFAV